MLALITAIAIIVTQEDIGKTASVCCLKGGLTAPAAQGQESLTEQTAIDFIKNRHLFLGCRF